MFRLEKNHIETSIREIYLQRIAHNKRQVFSFESFLWDYVGHPEFKKRVE
jgi:hypothetical protein